MGGEIVIRMAKSLAGCAEACGLKGVLQSNPIQKITGSETVKLQGALEKDVVSLANSTESFFQKFKENLKKLITDKDGNLIFREDNVTKLVEIPEKDKHLYPDYVGINGKWFYEKFISKGKELKLNLEKEFKLLEEPLGIIEHGTSAEAYNEILKHGFKHSDNFAETFKGIYFTRLADGANNYGEKCLRAKVKGKIATGNPRLIYEFCSHPSAIDDFLQKNNLTQISSYELKEMLLKDILKSKGYVGFLSDSIAPFAKCKALVIFDPENIKLLQNQ